ncbi:MAG: glucosyltransferase domain-containing protein [Lachnospiraceae bacterium]|nr:glucosyltransferase domain-containing protein [Lachnospiraceae bacterium]
MLELIEDLLYFFRKRIYCVGLITTMLLSYATLLIRPTIGIDDTSFKLYYIDGVSPAMGRWCLFIIHRFFPLDYNPYFVESIGLLLFCVSVSLWCIVFKRLFENRIPLIGYLFFSCVMISSPILSEVVVWYVQDGIYLGYGVTALAVLAGMKAFSGEKFTRENFRYTLLSASLLAVALGFYEAFMIVYLMAMVMCFMLIRVFQINTYTNRPIRWLLNTLSLCVVTMILRSLFINGISAVFQLQEQALVLKSRGLSDIMLLMRGLLDGSRNAEEFMLVLKEFWIKYNIHGIVYFPVFVLVLAKAILIVWGIVRSIMQKDVWIAVAMVGILLLPWSMPFLEGTATYYRSSEYVPLITAFASLIVVYEVSRNEKPTWVRLGVVVLSFSLLYHQAYEMNKWLLIDANKYDDDKRMMSALAIELMRDYDINKPICVVGNRQTPVSLLEKVYIPEWSKKYVLVKAFVCAVDERVFEKYNTEWGYAVAESPQLSFVNWANKAYYGFDRELIKFWKMHGFSFIEDGELTHYRQAEEQMKDAPVWPERGSIVEMEDHIVVNLGNF